MDIKKKRRLNFFICFVQFLLIICTQKKKKKKKRNHKQPSSTKKFPSFSHTTELRFFALVFFKKTYTHTNLKIEHTHCGFRLLGCLTFSFFN